MLGVNNLAPDIVEAIAAGAEPDGLSIAQIMKNIPEDWNEQRKSYGFPERWLRNPLDGRRNPAAFFCVYKGVSRRLLQSSDKWQRAAEKLIFLAVLLNNLTKTHAKLCALFLYFPLRWNIFKKVTVGVILRRNDFLHPPWKFQKFTKRIVQRRKTFLNSPQKRSTAIYDRRIWRKTESANGAFSW